MLAGAIAKAGHKPNPMPYEQSQRIHKELALATANGATVYQARVCLHPKTREFYTVPKWAEVCSDGKPVRQGNAIDPASPAQNRQTIIERSRHHGIRFYGFVR